MGVLASDIKVKVIGGGVIGLTTGLIMKLHGFNVSIISEHSLEGLHSDDLSKRPPEFASIHAAASVIPHSVDHPNAAQILAVSQRFFDILAFSGGMGVRVQRHFELFEDRPNFPEYARKVNDFRYLPDDGTGWLMDKRIPRRSEADRIYGWDFDAFFLEVPTYMQMLRDLCNASGCLLKSNMRIESTDEMIEMDADVIINCTGRWTTDLFPSTKHNTKVIRGHMVKIGIHEVPRLFDTKKYFSYNYCPCKDKYSRKTTDGEGNQVREHADVYFYPRSDGWLIGGSRQEGYPDIGKDWREKDEQISGKTFIKKGWSIPIPKPVWDLNRELLLDITNVDIADPKYPSFSYVGYRFSSDPIRVEKGDELASSDKLLVHNYGHGGAGYTLSWGTAYEVLKIVQENLDVDFEISNQAGLSKNYLSSLRRILLDCVKKEYIERYKEKLTPYVQTGV